MKKHQLLEKAMRDYPAGTRFKWNGNEEYVSSGIFCFRDESPDAVFDYQTDEVVCVDKCLWATIIPAEKPSLLSGKVAIQVNNEREFKLLMEHYESKGWKSLSGDSPSMVGYVPFSWRYEDGFGHGSPEFRKAEGCTIIPFSDFADECGIEVPVKLFVSKDGIDIYDGDLIFVVSKPGKEWGLNCSQHVHIWYNAVNKPDQFPCFSTKEAAEKWVSEQNKLNEVEVTANTILPFLTDLKEKGNPLTWLTKWQDKDHCMITIHVKSLKCDTNS